MITPISMHRNNNTEVKRAEYQNKSALYRICWYIGACVFYVDKPMLNRRIDQLLGHLELGIFVRGRDVDERDVCSRCHDLILVTKTLK